MENNIIQHKAMQFANQVILQAQAIPPAHRILAHQLVRSGTAIGASVSEAQSAESMSDFIHKMKIADKEVNESLYWLKLLETHVDGFGISLKEDLSEIKRLLASIIITCRKKQKR